MWNPYLGGGAPFAANFQSAVFYPLNAIFLLPLPLESALGYSMVLHLALAGVFTYVLGRQLGLGRPAAWLAGLTYMLGGPLMARAGFLSMSCTAAWLPFLIWTVERALRC